MVLIWLLLHGHLTGLGIVAATMCTFGRGRVSNELRRRYAEQFRLGAVPGGTTNEALMPDEDE